MGPRGAFLFVEYYACGAFWTALIGGTFDDSNNNCWSRGQGTEGSLHERKKDTSYLSLETTKWQAQLRILTVQPPVAIIRFNNPKSLNSINGAILHRLAYLLDEVAERPDITVTVLTGTGRFFSSGGDVGLEKPGGGKPEEQESAREWLLTNFCMPWLTATRSVFRHPKILVAALNGPVVGAPAGLVAFADFIYAMPHTYLATPFTSLALGAEGGSSFSLKERLGAAKTNEALLMGKRITCHELVQCGFLNKVFKANSESDNDTFMKQVLSEIDEWLGPHLDPAALLLTKRQLRAEDYERQDAVVVKEVMGALNAFLTGRPQAESKKFMTGQKRHKL